MSAPDDYPYPTYRVIYDEDDETGCRVTLAAGVHDIDRLTEDTKVRLEYIDKRARNRMAELVAEGRLDPEGRHGCLVVREFCVADGTFCLLVRGYSSERLTGVMFDELVFEEIGALGGVTLVEGHELELSISRTPERDSDRLLILELLNCQLLGLQPD